MGHFIFTSKADRSQFEKEIDVLVYKLYNLTYKNYRGLVNAVINCYFLEIKNDVI